MGSKLKASGIFFGIIFLTAAAINFSVRLATDGDTIISALLDFKDISSLLAISAAMFASGYISKLAWLQPAIFLVVVPIPILSNPESFYGLGFFAVAVLLLFKLDFYKVHGVLKTIGSIVYIVVLEVCSSLISKKDMYTGLMAVIFIIGFLFFLYLTYRERIVVYLKEPKAKLSLDEKGLSEAEQNYIRAMAKGKNVKEISFHFGVSESTVRNTLSRAYKKLAINSKSGLATIVEKYEIVK